MPEFNPLAFLQGPYLDMMVGSASFGFSDLVVVGERIENYLKNGKFQGVVVVSDKEKKSYSEFTKKKEGETNDVEIAKGNNGAYQVP